MNVTLGVPRLKEIINASNIISTPIIEARLVQNDSMTLARIVKAQIEKTCLGEVALYIKEIYCSSQSYVVVKLDLKRIRQLHLSINAYTVKNSILHSNASTSARPAILRMLTNLSIIVSGKHNDKLKIFAPESTKENSKGIPVSQKIYFMMQALKNALPSVIVQGF